MNDQFSLDDSDDQIQLRSAWNHVSKRLKEAIQGQSFERFIRPLKPVALDDQSVTLVAPGKFVQEWVNNRCRPMIESYLSDELGRPIVLQLQWELQDKPPVPKPVSVVPSVIDEPSKFQPNDRYTFGTFVVGQSNRLAHAGACAVAAEPGAKFNPLFICGPSGLGKTHLMHAIAFEVLKRNPRFSLAYLTAQQFAEEFVGALQNNRVESFRRSLRNVSLWLIDDIQMVAGKDKTQEEVFHTFNHLYSFGKQIVICADRPPRDLHLMDERLRSRFEAGLVADIQMPDTETRCAIIQSKALHDGISIDHAIAFYLAENVPGNIRQLEGALTRMAVMASLEGRPIEMELATTMVDKYYRGSLEKPGVGEIIEAVGRHYKITPEEIRGSSRKAPIVEARHIAIFITREITKSSWKHIGSQYGNRDHTSMMHGYQKVQEMLVHDKQLKTIVRTMIRDLYPHA
jgi:chromosomal replication initiator protein